MRGRKPKPTALKDLHGSEEPRNPLEPIPEGALTEVPASSCPDHFNADQRDAWEFAVRHSPPGMLKRIDAPALEAWVTALCLHRRALAQVNRTGMLVRNGTQMIPNPYIGIVNKQALVMLKAAAELGFTPVSRPRILAGGVIPASARDDNLAHHGRDSPKQSIEAYLARDPRSSAIH
jgi:P27 family predicted phage terminase small subunit